MSADNEWLLPDLPLDGMLGVDSPWKLGMGEETTAHHNDWTDGGSDNPAICNAHTGLQTFDWSNGQSILPGNDALGPVPTAICGERQPADLSQKARLPTAALWSAIETVQVSLREMSNWARNFHRTMQDAFHSLKSTIEDLSRRTTTLETITHRLAPCEAYGPRLAAAEARFPNLTSQIEAQDRRLAEMERRLAEAELKAGEAERRLTDFDRRQLEQTKKADEREAQHTSREAYVENCLQETRRYLWRWSHSQSRGRVRDGDRSREKSRGRSERASVEPLDPLGR